MSSGFPLANIEKLTGRDNYATWKFAVKNYLQHEELWEFIDPGPETREDKVKDIKAKSKIILLIDPINYIHVQEAQTAKQVWSNLEKAFDDSGLTRKVGLLRDLITTTLDNCDSVEDYVNKIMSTSHKLRNIGFSVGDEWLGTLLLAGLPDTYKPMIMAIESSGNAITADSVKTKILQDVKESKPNVAFYAKNKYNAKSLQNTNQSRPQAKGPRCFNCNKYGHLSKHCYFQKKKPVNNLKQGKDNNTYFAAFSAGSNLENNCWYIDSGASMHMCNRFEWLYDVVAPPISSIKVADSKMLMVEACGKTDLVIKDSDGTEKKIQVKNVLYVPELTTNLLSVSQMTKSNCDVIFEKDGCKIFQNNKLILKASCMNNMYKVSTAEATVFLTTVQEENAYIWHQRMGHLNFTDLQKINECTEGVKVSVPKNGFVCDTCLKGKQSRLPFKHTGTRATELLELIHSDICGPMEVSSLGKAKYFLTFTDDFSRKVFVYPIKNKSETLDKFKDFRNLVEKQTGKSIKILRSDNGTEYINQDFDKYMKASGIRHQTTNPYTSEQNGLAERMNRTLIERAKCLLLNSRLRKDFWAEAVCTAAYIINRSPTRALDYRTPEELWSGKKPNLEHMRVFGCPAMVHIPKQRRLKWDPKSIEVIFVGYCNDTKGYRLYDESKKTVIKSRDVIFKENTVMDMSVPVPLSDSKLLEETEQSTSSTKEGSNTSTDEALTDDSFLSVQERIDSSDEDYIPENDLKSLVPSNITLRPRNKIVRPTFLCYNDTPEPPSHLMYAEPRTVEEALSCNDADQWKAAMDSEFQSLIQNNTWTLSDLPDNKRAIPCKWLFKVKTNADGNIERYKARLVIKGYRQQKGVEYDEVYAPVVRHTSIRYLLSLAVKYKLHIEQIDAVTAFLQGDIDTEIYMTQPPLYEHGEKVCKLNKSIYGLKQASRQWNLKLSATLKELGFISSSLDTCVYYQINAKHMIYIILYVDDMLLFSNNKEKAENIKQNLIKKFHIKDLGKVHHFIGWRITQSEDRSKIYIDQTAYIEKILHRFNMTDCKSVSSPCDPSNKLLATQEDECILKDVPYQEAIGSLLYLSYGTRPDICFAVNKLSSFNKKPEIQHWIAVKRIIRFLKGTKDLRISYIENKDEKQIYGFSDSDWASDYDSRRSCSGYIFLFQGAPVSWCSKKQSTVALSTMEAEYMALSAATQEALWLRQLEAQLRPHDPAGPAGPCDPTLIYCDNQSAIHFAGKESYNARSKHIDIKFHFLREKIANKEIKVNYVETNNMIADVLTKATFKHQVENCSKMMGLINFSNFN